MPDVFTYRLAVVGPGGSDPIEFDDVSAPPEVRLLVDFVNRTGERTVP